MEAETQTAAVCAVMSHVYEAGHVSGPDEFLFLFARFDAERLNVVTLE